MAGRPAGCCAGSFPDERHGSNRDSGAGQPGGALFLCLQQRVCGILLSGAVLPCSEYKGKPYGGGTAACIFRQLWSPPYPLWKRSRPYNLCVGLCAPEGLLESGHHHGGNGPCYFLFDWPSLLETHWSLVRYPEVVEC